MKLSVIGLGLLIAGAVALAPPAFAREPGAITTVTPRPAAPTATTTAPKAAPKKLAVKPAAAAAATWQG